MQKHRCNHCLQYCYVPGLTNSGILINSILQVSIQKTKERYGTWWYKCINIYKEESSVLTRQLWKYEFSYIALHVSQWKDFPQTSIWLCMFPTFSSSVAHISTGCCGTHMHSHTALPCASHHHTQWAGRSVAGSHSYTRVSGTPHRRDWSSYRYIPSNPKSMYPKCMLPLARGKSCQTTTQHTKLTQHEGSVIEKSEWTTGPGALTDCHWNILLLKILLKHMTTWLGLGRSPCRWSIPFLSWNAEDTGSSQTKPVSKPIKWNR